jgi:hypothetical protein
MDFVCKDECSVFEINKALHQITIPEAENTDLASVRH